MHLVRISMPASSLDDDKKTRMIAKVTDAVVEADGVPGARQFTRALIDEVPDGGWDIAGRTVTLAKIQASLGMTESAG